MTLRIICGFFALLFAYWCVSKEWDAYGRSGALLLALIFGLVAMGYAS